jgi:endonuclease/exonuclease/phosphatase family metal-dependent hydrolase
MNFTQTYILSIHKAFSYDHLPVYLRPLNFSMKAKLSFIALFTFALFQSNAQEVQVVRLMQYNLLNYRSFNSFCTSSSNPPSVKEDALKTIIEEYEPDILACNEIGAFSGNSDSILSCLNVNGVTHYERAQYTTTIGSSITNMLFYNSEVFTLERQGQVRNDVNGIRLIRLIDLYQLYFNDPNLSLGADTNRLYVFVAHLKAGSSTSDENQREDAAEALMKYIADEQITGNILLMGDLNVKGASEPAFQQLISSGLTQERFFDPISEVGEWNNNFQYRFTHTQSTRTSSTNGGCFSGGGMDDRFDFILASFDIMTNSSGMRYVNTSYKAIGNDGNRFNESVNTPQNNSEPPAVIDALYDLSDHLPVTMAIAIEEGEPNALRGPSADDFHFLVRTKSHEAYVLLNEQGANEILRLYDLTGKCLHQQYLNRVSDWQRVDYQNIKPGIYIVEVQRDSGQRAAQKVVLF